MLREVGTIIEVAHNPQNGYVKTTTRVAILDENDVEKGSRIDELIEDGRSPKGLAQLAAHQKVLVDHDAVAVSEKLKGAAVQTGDLVKVATDRNAERARVEKETADRVAEEKRLEEERTQERLEAEALAAKEKK